MANNDNSQKGLDSDNMDPQTSDVQSKGGQASHDSGNSQSQQGSSHQQGQGNQNQSGSDNRDFGAMEEEGRDEEVSEIANLGGQSSHRGQNNEE